jgi:poly(A) polymerase/tRNA nucleotidyltransferase (CCA-adding enzyme)
VGGAVRDHLAGRPIHDVDVAAPHPPDEIAGRLRRAGLKVFETGIAHGTVTAVLAGSPVEVTALRRDVATDGRHAEVEWTTDWREDAARRDFTINAMSMERGGALHDFFGGAEDLRAGRVRFVGDPATRLREDYLRALRFFRFQARYGLGEPDPSAVAAIRAAVPGLPRLSAERVWMELKRVLEAPDPRASLALMAETGVLGAVLPEGVSLDALARAVAAGADDPLVRFAALLDAAAEVPSARLRMSGEERARLDAMRGDPARLPPGLDGAALLSLLAEWGPARAADASLVAEARDGQDRAALRSRIAALEVPAFPLQGRDALALGLQPGPWLGSALSELRAAWYAAGATEPRESLLEKLRELAAAKKR